VERGEDLVGPKTIRVGIFRGGQVHATSAGRVDRRRFLLGSVGAVAVGSAGSLLASCGGKDEAGGPTPTGAAASTAPTSSAASTAGSAGATSAASAGGPLPSYIPFTGFTYDLPPSAAGVDAGILTYPDASSLVSRAKDGVGGGSTITTMAAGISQLPPPVGRNKFWQELNKRLGATMKFNYPGQGSQYAAKLATALAGNDLADFVEIIPMPRLPDVLTTDFQDLTEHLAGDAVKDYPNLANLPTLAWKGAVYGGSIFGLPRPSTVAGNLVGVREDLRKKAGGPEKVESGDDFIALCRSLTDEKAGRWAATKPLQLVSVVQEMCGAPNQWKITDGAFTSAYAVDETRRALGLVADLWKEGLIFPDSFVNTTSSYKLAGAGKVGLMVGGFAQWLASVRDFRPDNPEFDIAGLILPKWDGGGPASHYLGSGFKNFTAMKKTADPNRVKQLLAVADWIASPYGTTQRDFLLFGIDGVDSAVKDGLRALTATGTAEITSLDVTVIAGPPPVLYAPGVSAQDVKSAHQWEESVIPDGLPWPTSGLFSETDLDKGASLTKALQDVQADVIQGRKQLSDWDNAVKTWKKEGGDQMAKEYAESYAAGN
jgi:putative aldouronate transport system substrate-binding protein